MGTSDKNSEQQNTICLYAADVRALRNSAFYERAYEAVSDTRRARTDRLAQLSDRCRSLGAELLLQYALKPYGISVRTESFQENAYGKPYLAAHPEIHYSISHSGDFVLLAVSDTPIGCDLEKCGVKELSAQKLRLAERFFCPSEYQELLSAAPEERPDRFYAYWTLKESLMKAAGLGMKLPLSASAFAMREEIRATAADVNTDFDPEYQAVLHKLSSGYYSFSLYDTIPGYQAALCVESAGRESKLNLPEEITLVPLEDCFFEVRV